MRVSCVSLLCLPTRAPLKQRRGIYKRTLLLFFFYCCIPGTIYIKIKSAAFPSKFENLVQFLDDSFGKYSNKSYMNLLEGPLAATEKPAVPIYSVER